MRRIIGKEPKGMKSPIRHVMEHIHEAIINIAPENKDTFIEDHKNIDIEYIESHEWILNANTNPNLIKVSSKVIEVLWSASYSYMIFYTKVVQGRFAEGVQEVDLHEDPEVSAAMRLLKWGFETMIGLGDPSWPSDLPEPISMPKRGTMESVADELCLCATAFVLHHELAHVRLRHEGPSNIESEKDADNAAVDWIMNHDLIETDYRFIKRLLGIAISFEVMTAYGIYTGNMGGHLHPYSYDRLYQAVDRYVEDPQHVIWAFLAAVLKLHLDNKGISCPRNVYENFRDCVNSHIDTISMLHD